MITALIALAAAGAIWAWWSGRAERYRLAAEVDWQARRIRHLQDRNAALRDELEAMAGELVRRSWEHRDQQALTAAAAPTPDDLTGLADADDLEAAVLADIAALPTYIADTTEEQP